MMLVPGHKDDWLHKAESFASDLLVLDLQDSVPLDAAAKALARSQVASMIRRQAHQARELGVRINGVLTPWILDDMRMAVECGAHSIVFPEVRSLREVHFLELLIAQLALDGAGPGPSIILEVETPELLCSLEQIASQSSLIDGLCVAPFDYALNTEAQVPLLGLPGMPTDDHMAWLRPKLVAVARAYGWTASDAVLVSDPKNLDLVKEAASRSRRSGFDGSAVLHPSHVDTVNACFSISAEELAWASGLISDPTAPRLRQHQQLAQRLLNDSQRIQSPPRPIGNPPRNPA